VNPTSAELRALARREPVLGRAMRRVPPFPGFPAGAAHDSHFHALARAIVYQQLAGKAAATIHGRVKRLSAGSRFPRPDELLALPEGDLRGAGVSQAKTLALRDLATKALDGTLRLRSIGRLTDDDVVERLIQVRGIGVWSAQMFLLFRLGRLDVLPATDLGVQEGLRVLDGLDERPGPAEVEARAAPWHPLCSVASWVLWRLA